MKIKIITFVALLSTSNVFGGFDDNALPSTPSSGDGSTLPSTPSEAGNSTPSSGGGSSPSSSTGTGNKGSSNINGAKMTINNNQRNNKLTVKSGESTIVNTATINLGRGTNASGVKIKINNNQQNNRTNIKSSRGSTVINTATVYVQ